MNFLGKVKKSVIGDRLIQPTSSMIGQTISFFIGIIFLTFSFIILNNGLNFKNNGVEVEAIVTQVIEDDTQREIRIHYIFNGKEYNNKLGYWDESLDISDKIQILVLKNDPMKISTKNDYMLLSMLFLAIALVLIAIALFNIVSYVIEENRVYKLLSTGIKKTGVIVCDGQSKKTIHNYTSWEITATIDDKTYNSSPIWIKYSLIGITNYFVEIYIDEKNENNFYIDYLSIRRQDGGEINEK